MDNQAHAFVCPNCGANTTNRQNCEYCGSLLVRFADKNIAIDENQYGHTAFRFAGLENALTQNLEEQARTYGRNHIHTLITSPSLGLELDVTNPKAQTELIIYTWGDSNSFRIKPAILPNTDEQSLVICIRFYEITSKMWAADTRYSHGIAPELNQANAEAHTRFQEMLIYDLFQLQTDKIVDVVTGMKVGNVYQYYLNFGRDVEGAASIITQYLLGNYEIANPQNLRLGYKLSSSTDEEYNEGVKEATKSSNTMFWFTVAMSAFGLICGASLLFFEEVFIGVVSLITGAGILYFALKYLKQ